ncbi:MAG: PQQ-binding-like beta-propeller repeat protein [Deltaproteobacteria bacterium]|nr:PQQ-binding-like beta-propeller repeat protein [Deltaproteobacteria bacterium]MCL5278060.1 PQQ-binding-like beta-propeller repeat protein [Deltaproteobacteria bacterium]
MRTIIVLSLLFASISAQSVKALFSYKIVPTNYLILHTDLRLNGNELCKPIIKDDVLYQGLHSGLILSQDIENKRILWRFMGVGSPTSAVLYKNILIVSTLKGLVYALNGSSGKLIWSYNTQKQILSRIRVYDYTAYVQTTLDTLYAFDIRDGSLIWQYASKDIVGGLVVHATPTPYISNDVIFTGFSNGSTVALDAKTGKLLWERKPNLIKQFQDIVASPAINKDVVIFGSYENGLSCLNKQDGTIVWERSDLKRPLGLSITGNAVYVTRATGDLYRLDLRTGDTIWKTNLGEKVRLFTPYQLYSLIVVGVDNGKNKGIVVLDPDDGTIKQRFSIVSGLSAGPVLSGNRIYAVSNGGFLYCYELSPANRQKRDFFKGLL